MLRDFRDLDPDELREELRCGRDAQHRRQAALELGDLNDMGGVPWLLNAVLHDPDMSVARAARDILRGMIGANLDEALKLEASGEPLEDPWLTEACMLEEDWDADLAEVEDWTESGEAAAALTTEQSEMLHGLTLVVRGEPNPALRIKAVHALGKIPDMEAIRVLAELAISENAEAVRAAAHDVLEQRFGDDLPELLNFTRLEVNGTVEVEDGEPQGEQWETVRQIAAEHPPVMEEENRGRWVWIVLGGLAVAGLLLALTLR